MFNLDFLEYFIFSLVLEATLLHPLRPLYIFKTVISLYENSFSAPPCSALSQLQPFQPVIYYHSPPSSGASHSKPSSGRLHRGII